MNILYLHFISQRNRCKGAGHLLDRRDVRNSASPRAPVPGYEVPDEEAVQCPQHQHDPRAAPAADNHNSV